VHSCVHQRKFDILSGVQPVEQIEILKDETDFAISYCSQIVRRKIGSLDAIDPAFAARYGRSAGDLPRSARVAENTRRS
jgi:hypothetical protein